MVWKIEMRLKEMQAKLDKIQLDGLEEYPLARTLSRLLYDVFVFQQNPKHPMIVQIMAIVARGITNRVEFKKNGDGSIICYCARPMAINRADHLNNFNKVANLITNRTLMVGVALQGLTFRRLKYLVLPLKWYKKLKKVTEDRGLRMVMIRELFSAYSDFLEYEQYGKSTQICGFLTLEEQNTSSQLLIQKLKKEGIPTVVLMHGAYDADSYTEYYIKTWGCDYIISYSPASTSWLEKVGGYPGEVRELGMYHYIDSEFANKNYENADRIGIFFDGPNSNDVNMEMVETVVSACLDTDKKIYIKIHPSCSSDYVESCKAHIKSPNVVEIFHKTPQSIEIENMVDIVICRNSTCLFEAIYQKIPTFRFNKGEMHYIDMDSGLFFSTSEELKKRIKQVENRELDVVLEQRKYHLCGSDNPKLRYKQFFKELNWV